MNLLILLIGEFILLLVLSYMILNSILNAASEGAVALFCSTIISIALTLITWGILA
jgi:hypothetical protein